MKKTYQEPEMNILLVASENILTASSDMSEPIKGAFWGESDPLELA